MKYDPANIEPKWQNYWESKKTFSVQEDPNKPKYYALDMFPYPSGAGLHVGHPEGYTATDIICRHKRMKGFNVLHPMGWDAFGLPAEQYALETGTHPAVTTRKNIDNFRRQIKQLGFSYDWDREVATCDADYYKWTQWIFSKLYEKGLAYMAEVPVNWCPALGTVLANEEVIDGKSERGGHDVIRKPMLQWILKITDYADSLLEGLEDLDWPEGVKNQQRHWIGKSQGATVYFKVADSENLQFEIYTTRPDTLFGATYCVIAPEHPLLEEIVSDDCKEKVVKYATDAKNKLDRVRQEDANKKTGEFTGAYALNPVNGEKLPIFVADYVLMTYGSGAIMAVPGHDQRDWEFAKKFELPIVEVVSGGDIAKEAWTGDGKLINSGMLDGLEVDTAKKKIISWLEEKNLGRSTINYKLRDWLFSRQRYWGEPFPIVHTENGPQLLPENELPVVLPEVERYQPTEDGEPPLARAKDWLTHESGAQRETNTMPQWAGSCWYYLRYIDPKNSEQAWDKEKEQYWMPVDLYIGGAEHAVLHLLYSRFWHHVLFDLGLVSTKEPFQRLVNQGMILGEDNVKMSKSRGNVVNPDDIISEFGADTLRVYEMFMGPLEQVKPWNTRSVGGMHRFLSRAWRALVSDDGSLKLSDGSASEKLEKAIHKTVMKVGDDIDNLKFHTAIASLMTFVNDAIEENSMSRSVAEKFVLILSPFAPHLAEELWEKLGHSETLAYQSWPEYDPKLVVDDTITIAIQVNGKKRDTIDVARDLDKEALLDSVKELASIQKNIDGKSIVKEIVVPGKLVNLVVK